MRHQLPAYSPVTLGAIWSASRPPGTRDGAFEELLSHRFRAEQVVLAGSGTQALQLAMTVAVQGRPAPARVALPAYSCYDLVSAAIGAGVEAVFYDVDPSTLSPDLESLRAALSREVIAVVAGNLFGFPLDWGALRRECGDRGVTLIEDAAQGVGIESDDGPGGSLGDLSVLSFSRGKGWTGGGGGALLLRGDFVGDVPVALASGSGIDLRAMTASVGAWLLGRPALYGVATRLPLGLGETRFHPPTPPETMSAFSKGLAMATAGTARDAVAARTEIAAQLREVLEEDSRSGNLFRTCLPVLPRATPSYLRFPLVMRSPEAAERVLRRAYRWGVAQGYPQALPSIAQVGTICADCGYVRVPGARKLAGCLVTLPTHKWVDSKDIRGIVESLEA